MGEKEYLVFLPQTDQDRYRHYSVTVEGRVVHFSIQYEALIKGKWRQIVRYDSAHGRPHKDIMHPDGSQTKVDFLYHAIMVL